MTGNSIGFNAVDGSIRFEELNFKPVDPKDAESVNSLSNGLSLSIVKFDAFKNIGEEFIGYLDFYFNGVGNYVYIETRKGKDGKLYAKMENKSIEGRYGKWQGNQKDIILNVASYVADMYGKNGKQNPIEGNWKPIEKELKARSTGIIGDST